MPAAETVIKGAHADLPGVKLWFTDSGDAAGRSCCFIRTPAQAKSGSRRPVPSPRPATASSRSTAAAGAAASPMPHRERWLAASPSDLDALSDHLKLARFHLIGVAGGGFAALDYAAWCPERVQSLIVGASTGDMSEPAIADFKERIAIPEIRKQPPVYFEVGPSYRGANPEGPPAGSPSTSVRVKAVRPPSRCAPPTPFAKIATITAPALVIAADADLLAPPALMRIWARHLKDYEWAAIHDAGHAMAWEQPGRFNDLVLDFLRRH